MAFGKEFNRFVFIEFYGFSFCELCLFFLFKLLLTLYFGFMYVHMYLSDFKFLASY